MFPFHRLILAILVLLTATIVQSCTMVDVVKGSYIPMELDSQDLMIQTDSVVGSEEWVYVSFYTDNDQYAGRVVIYFRSPLNYWIGSRSCSSSPFPVSPPAEREKTWRISYDRAAWRLTIYCNDVEVVNMVLSDVCDWSDYWGRKTTQIMFSAYSDSASDQYCTVDRECSELPKDNGWDDDNLRVLNPTDFTTNPVEYGTTITVGCNPGYTLMKDGAEVAELMIKCKGGPDNFVDRWTDTLSPISCDIKQPSPTDDGNTTVIVLLIVAVGIGVAILIVLIWMIAACAYMARHPHTKFGDVMCCKTGRTDNCDLPEVGNEFQLRHV